jgi:DNA-3-methyladenine glycosylase II
MDLQVATAHLKQFDPHLGALIDRVGPCGLPPANLEGSLLQALGRSIFYQQLSGKAAATILGRFVALYGVFPEAQQILATPDEALRAVGVSGQKVRYLKDLALRVEQGLPSLVELAQLEDEEIIRLLTQVKGVGRWTVEMLLMFRLGRLDVWPVDDLGVKSGVKRVYGQAALPSRQELAVLGLPWKPYRSVCAWYFWQSVDLPATTVR